VEPLVIGKRPVDTEDLVDEAPPQPHVAVVDAMAVVRKQGLHVTLDPAHELGCVAIA